MLPADREGGQRIPGDVIRVSTRCRSPARPLAGRQEVGRSLATERLKRVSLELGGKSAAIVLDDVDGNQCGRLHARLLGLDEQWPGMCQHRRASLRRGRVTTRWGTEALVANASL